MDHPVLSQLLQISVRVGYQSLTQWDGLTVAKGILCIIPTVRDIGVVERFRGGQPGDGDTSDRLWLSRSRVTALGIRMGIKAPHTGQFCDSSGVKIKK